jgi:MFS transporter, Spinster family, sphingosine-1-phosphate transporter
MPRLLKPAWTLVAYLWVCYVLNHADRQVVYTLFPALQSEFNLSDAMLGLTGALFLWVYGLCSPLAGILGDRWPKSHVVAGSLALWSLFTLLTGWAPNGMVMLTLRALLGVAESFFMPAALALIAAAHGPESRSRAISIFVTSQLAGVALGGSLSGWLAEKYEWRLAFWLLGTAGLLFAVPLWRFLRTLPFEERPRGEPASARGFLDLMRIPTLRIIGLFVGVGTFGLFLVYTWLPTYLHDRFGLGLAQAGWEASVYPQIGTGLGLLCGGLLADRLFAWKRTARLWLVAIAFFTAGPAIYVLSEMTALAGVRLAAMAFGFFAGFISGNQVACAFDVAPVAQRASATGVLNLLGASVSGFAPFLGGLARRTVGVDRLMAFTGGLYCLTGVCVLYAIWRHFERDYRRAQER